MILKNKMLIALTTLVLAGGLSFGGYMLFNKLNDKQETPKEEKVPELNQEEHDNNKETTEKEKYYYWDGIYSNGKKTYTIIKFEGYAFMYDAEQTMGVRILEEKNSELLSFQNDMTLKIEDNNLIVDSKTNKYKHYAGTFKKEEFVNKFSGEYKLDDHQLKLRQVSKDKVFFRIINTAKETEYYNFANILSSSKITLDDIEGILTIQKINENMIPKMKLIIDSIDNNHFLKEAEGSYSPNY